MLQVIQEVNTVTGHPICNETTCPTMSAGRYVKANPRDCNEIWTDHWNIHTALPTPG
jgi:hypothetical protein